MGVEEEGNAMEELTEPVTVDVSVVPSLEAIVQLTDQMADDVDIRDGSERGRKLTLHYITLVFRPLQLL